MKKLRLSLAALALIVAIAGTATANANAEELEPCKTFDPKEQICLNEWPVECCENGAEIKLYALPF